MNRLMLLFALVCNFILGCVSPEHLQKRLHQGRLYEGWYINSPQIRLFVIDQKNPLKRKIAVSLSQLNRYNLFFEPGKSFLKKCESNVDTLHSYFKVNNNDPIFYSNKVSIVRGKIFLNKFENYVRYELDTLNEGITIANYVYRKVKASNGTKVIKAIWLDGSTTVDHIVLYSNCTSDSLNL